MKDIKDTPPPTPVATCHTAGTKLIELVVAGQNPPPPDDAVNQLIQLVEKRCSTDGWKQEARECFSKVKGVEDADACAKTLSEQELANLSGDMAPPDGQAPAGGAKEDMEGGSGTQGGSGAKPGSGAKSGSGTRGPGDGAAGDPCDGGE